MQPSAPGEGTLEGLYPIRTSSCCEQSTGRSWRLSRKIHPGPSTDKGSTLGRDYRHWRRAKIGRRFRLFFRYDAKAKVIVYAWINDENTLRSSGSKTDPYAVFTRMLAQGNPPDDWASLIASSAQNPSPEQ